MILVVGATGRLGTAVTAELLARGHRVRAGCRTPEKAAELVALGAEAVRIDLREAASFAEAWVGVEQVVATVQGLTARRADSISQVDLHGHRQLIDASVAASVQRFVYVSAKGADPMHPAAFLRAKAEVEQYLVASGLPHHVFRPSAFMDLYAHELIGKAVLARKTVRLLGDGRTPRNLVAVGDVAAAVIAAIEGRLSDGFYDVVGASNATDREIAALYGRLSGHPVKVVSMPPMVRNIIARMIGPFHAGVRNLLLFGDQMERHGGLVADASGMGAIIGREASGLDAFVTARVAEFAKTAK